MKIWYQDMGLSCVVTDVISRQVLVVVLFIKRITSQAALSEYYRTVY